MRLTNVGSKRRLANGNGAGDDPCPVPLSYLSVLSPPQLQVVPLTANDAGTAFVVLFQVPVNPMPL
jgi:hypothetical protein